MTDMPETAAWTLETVFTQNFSKGDKCLPGRMVECIGPVSFKVELEREVLLHIWTVAYMEHQLR